MLSVISVTYYSSHIIKEFFLNLSSVLSDITFELIVVNNSIEDKITNPDSKKCTIINLSKNKGYGSAINVGVINAKFSNLLIINPDLHLKTFAIPFGENQLGLCGGFIEEHPEGHPFPPLFRDTMRMTVKRIFPWRFLNFVLDVPHKKITDNMQDVDYFSGSLFFTNKKSFELIGGFDEQFFLFYEEIDFCRRAKIQQIPVFIDSDIRYNHSIKNTASKIDVSQIKTISEVESFELYHKKYNGKTKTKIAMAFIFCFSLFFYLPFCFLSFIFNSKYFATRKHLFKTYLKQ